MPPRLVSTLSGPRLHSLPCYASTADRWRASPVPRQSQWLDMDNPWKSIPLSDYEGHMELPEIGQASMLADEFGKLLREHRRKEVALIGCAGGNGFENAAAAGVVRLVGLDINGEYVERARERFSHVVAGLELHVADIEGDLPPIEPVDAVFAALVFEYVDVERALRNVVGLCRKGAMVGTVLQLPKADADAVSNSPYASLKAVGSIMRLVPPPELRAVAETAGLGFVSERTVALASGKRFAVQVFRA